MHTTEQGTDALTGLAQYDGFIEQLEMDMAQAEKDGGSVSMALIDIDWFAKLNKEYGSAAGDGVLKALSAFLQEMFSGRGQVYRYGGDAFAVLLADVEKEEAFLLLEEARRSFVGDHEVEAGDTRATVPISITVGVAAVPDDANTPQELTRKANEAVYRAKVGGRAKVCLAREEKMVTKTSHYTQGQLHGLSRLAKREGIGEAVLLREALDDLLRKYNA
jgi:diguanylate cyclase (GGDEF)-like protein